MSTGTGEVRSVCPYCGVGCGLRMQVGATGRIERVSGDPEHPANHGRLCTKGQTCAEPLMAPGRLDAAFLRQARHLPPVQVDMDQAIRETGRRLRALVDQHGPDAVALYVSGQMSMEAQYLANKLAKGFIGTNQIESNSRLCMASAAAGYKQSFGADAPPGSYDDFDHTDLFFVIGANMADSHPILHLRMMDRVKAGARLIVVDPRRTATADKAHLYLPIRPGSDLALLNGLLHLLVANGRVDHAFIEQHTEGWDAMQALLADYPPARVAELTGLPEAQIRQAAEWIGDTPAWISCWTMGLNQSTQGTAHTTAVCNLHLATGALCKTGAGPFSLTGQPNAMGGREMGYMGPGLPGQRSVLSAADRQQVEALWGVPAGTLHTRSVGGTVALFERMAAGEIQACWIICTNPVASVPNRQTVIQALERAELVITQDAFLDTETNRHADILLPGALWAEADGVMVNSERNLTLARQVVAPPGQALPDWAIIARVACEMGYAEAFSYRSAAEVFEEITRFSNPETGYELRGASHARLLDGPLQWPCAPDSNGRRNPIRYREAADTAAPALRFATPSGKARFVAQAHQSPSEASSAEFPFVLNTGRLQHQWHTMTKTGKVATLNRLNPGSFIQIHPDDAVQLGVASGDTVALQSRRGRAVLPAQLSDRVQRGGCFVPIHWNDCFGDELAVNAVTTDAVDPVSLQPAFKHAAVVLTRVAAAARPDATSPAAGPESWQQGPEAVTLLWASQTGRTEGVALDAARRLGDAGWLVNLRRMDQCQPAELPPGQPLLLMSSTFGDGDPPDDAASFWQALMGLPTGPDNPLAGRPCAVLALGDPSYDQFCGFGRRLDQQVQALGATPLHPRSDCTPDFEIPARRWLAGVMQALAQRVPDRAPAQALQAALALADGLVDEDEAEHAGQDKAVRPQGISRRHPAHVPLRLNHVLNGPGANKEVRQLGFDLRESGVRYEAGDALGVWPSNCPATVAEMLGLLKLSPSALVSLDGPGDLPLAEALLTHLDISRITPEWLQFVLSRHPDADLSPLCLPDQAARFKAWTWGRHMVDVLQTVSIQVTAQEWVDQLKRLQPRQYSISSSPLAVPDEVQLTVSTVRFLHAGRARGGVCSSFLADRAADKPVPVFVQPSPHFRPPADADVPLIMVGPGTGVAPFRGFLQDRQARGHRGRNWLFFGEQHRETDFYYRDELLAWQADGHLSTLSLAFSRDQADKVYVQDRMREQGRELWAWLQEGAHFCVCGDAQRMARDVDDALRQIAQVHGGLSPEDAADYLTTLARSKRYVRDVY